MSDNTEAPCATHDVARCTICTPPVRQRLLDEITAKVVAEHGDAANLIDIEDLHVTVLAGYKAAVDVRIYNGATRVSRVGKIALTRGSRPAMLLVEPKWKGGVHTLGHNDVVVARRDPKAPTKGGWVNIAKIEDRNGVAVVKTKDEE